MMLKAKTQARQAAQKALKELDPASIAEQSQAVCESVRTLPAFVACRAVAVYLPMSSGRELDTWPLVEAIFDSADPKCVYIPKIEADGHMRVLRAQSLAELRGLPFNRWGCPEHTDEMVANMGLEDGTLTGAVDLVIVPALQFAPSVLARLGRGKGFYDRFLGRLDEQRVARGLPPAFKLGVGLNEQIVESIPEEQHDIRMDAVVCASGSYPPPERVR